MENKNKSKSSKINLSQLVLLGLGSLIGSGWLFGAWEASSIAGPKRHYFMDHRFHSYWNDSL